MSEREGAPRVHVVRAPKELAPAATWGLAAVLAVAGLAGGYALGVRTFNPGPPDERGEGAEPAGENPGNEGPSAAAGGGAARPTAERPAEPTAAPTAEPTAAPPAPRVPVRVERATLQGCGDGEELDTPGPQCAPEREAEALLRGVVAELGTCDAAWQAARTPAATLSLGLRVDFTRRRVSPLPGRSSTVANPLAYVACARTALADARALAPLWQSRPQRARYLWFFALRFGPLPPGVTGPDNAAAATPTAATPSAAPAEPAATNPAPAATAAAPLAPTPNAAASQNATPGTAAPAAAAPSAAPSAPAAPSAASTAAYPTFTLPRVERSTVSWPRAIVRAAPRDGAIVARLPQGTSLEVFARSGGWWEVRGQGVTGWVYGEAIGR